MKLNEPKVSQNIYKVIERERQNFAFSGISLFGEVLPKEEGRKLNGMGIKKECSLRRKMNVVACWLNIKGNKSFEQIKKVLDRDET